MTSCLHNDMRDRMHAMVVYVYVCIKWKRCDAVRAATERKLRIGLKKLSQHLNASQA